MKLTKTEMLLQSQLYTALYNSSGSKLFYNYYVYVFILQVGPIFVSLKLIWTLSELKEPSTLLVNLPIAVSTITTRNNHEIIISY